VAIHGRPIHFVDPKKAPRPPRGRHMPQLDMQAREIEWRERLKQLLKRRERG